MKIRRLVSASDTQPSKQSRRPAASHLKKTDAGGRTRLNELVTGVVTDAMEIAIREHCSVRSVNMTISLAFLAPSLVKAVLEGTLPRGIAYAPLCDLPAEWPRQYRVLGLAAQT